MEKTRSIGIMGGTFDPVHYGHLIVAEQCREEYGLEKVILIPAFLPPHKVDSRILESRHRYEMTCLATKDNRFLQVSDLEMKRKGYSYSIDTIEYYLNRYPGMDLHFILGLDAFLLIETWKDFKRALQLCTFIIVNRPGYSFNQEKLKEHFNVRVLFSNIKWFDIPGIDISSSYIRKRAGQKKTIKYLLPPAVEDYISSYKLYQEVGMASD